MAKPRPGRILTAFGLFVVVLLGATVVSGPRVNTAEAMPHADTVQFGEEAAMAWSDKELALFDPASVKESAAGLWKVGNQSIYGWNNGVTNAFSGDFNGDGKWDIGVTGTDKDGDRCWYIRYGNGQGSFGNETRYCWGNGVTNVFTGDFNGDGKWDIGVTGTKQQGDRYWYIRYGDGKGGFGNQTEYWWGNGVTNVFTGDFNGDGKWDIGVTGTKDEKERKWYIRYGDGRGQFKGDVVYDWGNGVTNVFTGDFNGDGKWDIGVTGTSTDRDRTWYIRYGNGRGGFDGEDTYTWNNGVTNVFTGDFNGDGLWDVGVTGDRVTRDGNWYIRYNQMPKAAKNGGSTGGSTPAQPDPKAKLAADMAAVAYDKLLGRPATQAEKDQWADKFVKGTVDLEGIWTGVAQSAERLQRYGYWAPAKVSYQGKREQCFGAVGPKCDGAPGTKTPEWVNKFTRPDGVEMGYYKVTTAVGSILHDNTCLRQPTGAWCSGWPSIPLAELPIIKNFIVAGMEWNKAVYNVRDGRGWIDYYGPYPTNDQLRSQFSDDLTSVDARPAKMAKIGILGTPFASPVTSEPYQGKETRATARLKAPATAVVDRGDAAYCASKAYKEDGQWWTMQWWGVCK